MNRVLGRLKVGHKLAVLGGVGLSAAVVVGAVGVRSLNELHRVEGERAAILAAQAEINFLHHRLSELKADGFHVYVTSEASGGSAAIAEEVVGDAATIGETWARIDAIDVDADTRAILE